MRNFSFFRNACHFLNSSTKSSGFRGNPRHFYNSSRRPSEFWWNARKVFDEVKEPLGFWGMITGGAILSAMAAKAQNDQEKYETAEYLEQNQGENRQIEFFTWTETIFLDNKNTSLIFHRERRVIPIQPEPKEPVSKPKI